MKRMTVLLIVLFVVLASITAAMSYSAAVVQSPVVLKVVPSDKALLALAPGEDTNNQCRIDNGVLHFDFKDYPLDSEWNWDALFTVTNNSAEDIKFTIDCQDISCLNLYAYPQDSSPTKTEIDNDVYYSLAPGDAACIGGVINIGCAPSIVSGTISVIAEAG